MSVCIIDYGIGNIASVRNAITSLGVICEVGSTAEIFDRHTHLILPGVGSFAGGMSGLKARGLIEVLHDQVIARRKNILGICLGMQLFATRGEEHGSHEGLGFIAGTVRQIDVSNGSLRLPHIGWNNVAVRPGYRIAEGFTDQPDFYFVHSFHFVPEDGSVVAGTCEYGETVTALIERDNIFGAQFHPEKSDTDGRRIFENFLSIA